MSESETSPILNDSNEENTTHQNMDYVKMDKQKSLTLKEPIVRIISYNVL